MINVALLIFVQSAAGLFFQEHAKEHEHDITDQHGGHKDLQTDELGHCIAHSRVARHIIEVSCHLLRSYHTDGHREGKSRKSRIELEGEEIREFDEDEQERCKHADVHECEENGMRCPIDIDQADDAEAAGCQQDRHGVVGCALDLDIHQTPEHEGQQDDVDNASVNGDHLEDWAGRR